jgi:hypothetical protein
MNNARSFRSIFMVASCAGAALGCYMISLRVASERSALEEVENRIVLAQRDVRTLQTEIGTRGRLAQLERWNVRVLALSAPSADQFLEGGFELARLTRPPETITMDAPVVLAAAPAPADRNALGADAIQDGDIVPADGGALLHQASLKVRLADQSPKAALGAKAATADPVRKTEVPAKAATKAAETKARPAKASAKKSAAAKAAATKAAATKTAPTKAASAKPIATKAVDKKSTVKKAVAAAKPVTRAPRLAKADPLAPLAEAKHGKTRKDSVAAR